MMKKILVFITLFLLVTHICFSQATPCPIEGRGKRQNLNEKEKERNREKNRSCVVSGQDEIDTISIEEIFKPGYDLNRFSIKKAITVRGYVILVKSGGPETCNCGS